MALEANAAPAALAAMVAMVAMAEADDLKRVSGKAGVLSLNQALVRQALSARITTTSKRLASSARWSSSLCPRSC